MGWFAFPTEHPVAFWIIAVVVILYHALRSIFNQRHWRSDDNARRKASKPPLEPWSRGEQVFIFQIHDFLFHVVCATFGFAALQVLSRVFGTIPRLADIGIGTAIFMSFLALVGLAGVAGVLPQLLLQGRLFGKMSGAG